MDSSDKLLTEHRQMLCLSKNISDFHVKNINGWSCIFFNGVKEVGIEYNFLDDVGVFCDGEVSIHLKTSPKAKQTKKGYDDFIKALKMLFFNNTKVTMYKNGKLWNYKSIPTTSRKKKEAR